MPVWGIQGVLVDRGIIPAFGMYFSPKVEYIAALEEDVGDILDTTTKKLAF